MIGELARFERVTLPSGLMPWRQGVWHEKEQTQDARQPACLVVATAKASSCLQILEVPTTHASQLFNDWTRVR
jgi:hypothetical protein